MLLEQLPIGGLQAAVEVVAEGRVGTGRGGKLAVVGLALLLFAIVFGLEACGPAGGVALVIALVGLVLVILA